MSIFWRVFSVIAETTGPEDTTGNEQNAPLGGADTESQREPLKEEDSQDQYPEESLGPAKAPWVVFLLFRKILILFKKFKMFLLHVQVMHVWAVQDFYSPGHGWYMGKRQRTLWIYPLFSIPGPMQCSSFLASKELISQSVVTSHVDVSFRSPLTSRDQWPYNQSHLSWPPHPLHWPLCHLQLHVDEPCHAKIGLKILVSVMTPSWHQPSQALRLDREAREIICLVASIHSAVQ